MKRKCYKDRRYHNSPPTQALKKYYLNNVKEFKKQYICKTKTECYNDRLEEYFRLREKK